MFCKQRFVMWVKMMEDEEKEPVNETPGFIKDVFDSGKH